MKVHGKFITKVALLLLIVSGCLGLNYVYAASQTVTIEADISQEIEGGLQTDLYKVAGVYWDPYAADYYCEPVNADYAALFDNKNLFVKKADHDGVQRIYFKSRMAEDGKTKIFVDEALMKDETFTYGCAKVALDGTTSPVSIPMSLSDGKTSGTKDITPSALYVFVARGAGLPKDEYLVKETDSKYTTIAYSYDKKYTFTPYIFFYNGLEEPNTKRVLKYEEDERFGQLNIIKIITQFDARPQDKPQIAVFRVEGYKSSDKTVKVYECVLTLEITRAGRYDPAFELKDIPVGTYVEVTEEYAGASYVLVSQKVQTVESILPLSHKDSPQEVEYINKFNDIPKRGYGYNNEFTKKVTVVDENNNIESWIPSEDTEGAGE